MLTYRANSITKKKGFQYIKIYYSIMLAYLCHKI